MTPSYRPGLFYLSVLTLVPALFYCVMHVGLLISCTIVLAQTGGKEHLFTHWYDIRHVAQIYQNQFQLWRSNVTSFPSFTHGFAIVSIPFACLIIALWRCYVLYANLRTGFLTPNYAKLLKTNRPASYRNYQP